MLFSDLYKIVVNEVTSIDFSGGDHTPGSAPASKTRQLIRTQMVAPATFTISRFSYFFRLLRIERNETVVRKDVRSLKTRLVA